MYILEGGYCGFYASRPALCDPSAYVPMDDPRHFLRRNSDLHDFRKFSRTRSFTYGEQQQQLHQQPNEDVPPPCPPLAFAAASAAVGRRHAIPMTIDEHDASSSSPGGGLGSSPCGAAGNGHEESPCPRMLSVGGGMGGGLQAPIFGSAKTRQFARAGFTRVASYAGTGTAR